MYTFLKFIISQCDLLILTLKFRLYLKISSSSWHSDLVATCTPILSFSSISSRYFLAKTLMSSCLYLWAVIIISSLLVQICVPLLIVIVTDPSMLLVSGMAADNLSLKSEALHYLRSFIMNSLLYLHDLSLCCQAGEKWPSWTMMIEELRSIEPCKSKIYSSEPSRPDSYISSEKVGFQDCIINYGNIYDEHLDNTGKLSRLMPSCCYWPWYPTIISTRSIKF